MSEKNVFICSKCGKIYKTKRGLTAHEGTHAGESASSQSFKCSVCQRSFKTSRGLQNHIRVHSAADQGETSSAAVPVSNIHDDAVDPVVAERQQCDVSDDEEGHNIPNNEQVISYFVEDDEIDLRSMELEDVTSGQTSNPKSKKIPLVKCNQCPKTFNAIDTFLKHKATHAMSDLYNSAPSEMDIARKSSDIIRTVLEEMGNSKHCVGHGLTLKDTSKVFLIVIDSEECGEIVDCLVNGVCSFFKNCDSCITASELRVEFLKSVAIFCTNRTERSHLVQGLQGMVDISDEAANLFYATLIRKFSNEILGFYIHSIVNKDDDSASFIPLHETFVVTSQLTDTLDFKQVMLYVGGANVKSLLRAAFRIKNNRHEWRRVIDIAKKYSLISELAEAPDEELMAWTKIQDRGKLTKISGNLLNFFVELGATVKILEHFDGSLYVDEAMEKVLDSTKLIYFWDETLKGSVAQDNSFKLLHALCSYFCSTWRNGIISRRLDELSAINVSVGVKHGISGVAFRASLQ